MHDEDKASIAAVVNREFARKVFGSVEKAVGGHFKFWGGNRAEVVGVVEDGKYQTLTEDPTPAMFFSFLQHPASDTWLVVRSQRDPQEIAPALQRAMRSLDPALPLEIRTWHNELDSALFAARVATVSLGVLGLLGAMLAITGIFGMAAYTVSKRLRELGIRIALGAGQHELLGAALGRTFRLLAIGSISPRNESTPWLSTRLTGSPAPWPTSPKSSNSSTSRASASCRSPSSSIPRPRWED
jgi:ABC-type antimicrobial peptide transport system permease subunit